MAKTYEQLKAEIAALTAEAEALRKSERPGVIDRIKVAIEHYELTVQDLFYSGRKPKAGTKRVRVPSSNVEALIRGTSARWRWDWQQPPNPSESDRIGEQLVR